jgi:hypothetical protein
MSIERDFDVAMLGIYTRAKVEANYTAKIYFDMLNRHRGLATAKALINATKPSDGYTALYERDRLDLTVEAMVLNEPRWHSLFLPEEIEKAEKRLKQYGYKGS